MAGFFDKDTFEFDFSNKKWDKYTKELKGKDLIEIYKNGDNLIIKPS